MITFHPSELYYGTVDTEMVQFSLDGEGLLFIKTLTGKRVFVCKGKWKQKSAFFGAGKIDCSMRYEGQLVEWQIRIYPLNERAHQETIWFSGRNGTFNHPTRPFSSRFGPNTDVIWEDET